MAELIAGAAVGAAVLIAGGGWLAAWSWRKGRDYARAMSAIDEIQNERDEVAP